MLFRVPLGTKASIARTILDLDDTQIDMMIQSAILKTPEPETQDDSPEEAPAGG